MMQYHIIFVFFLIRFEKSLAYDVQTNFHEHEPKPYNEIIPGEWILHISAGLEVAKRIADAEGFQNIYEIPGLNLFHLYNLKPSEDEQKEHISKRLDKYEEITYMTPSTREKVKSHQTLQSQGSMAEEKYFYCAGPENAYYTSDRPQFYKDPLYRDQWFLRSCLDLEGDESPSYYDMKIVQTWEHFKLTGKGIIVLVIDTGVYNDHLDLKYRISMKHSKNYITGNTDPTPKYADDTHGTRCAGIIAAEANNVCGVGIAPKATIGGQAYISRHEFKTRDKIEALKYNAEEVHIVSMSTGDDYDKAFVMMERELVPAFYYGIIHGRQGKGILYVFPSGNGKEEGETCSADGGLQTIYKIVVGGVKHDGAVSSYAEGCAAVMVVTHSGHGVPYSHVTPDHGAVNKCCYNFNGTSAGTPVAAGILALMLEANNDLTWRDVKYAIAWTSEVAPLAKNPGWTKNAAGFYVNFDLGFGLINAYELIDLAKNWPGPTPPMNECVVGYTLRRDETYISAMQTRSITIGTDGCRGTPQEINYIEHVLVTVTINHKASGFLQIMLISPQRTVTQLLPPRPYGFVKSHIEDFTFMSVHNWGEQPQGKWRVEIIDTGKSSNIYGEISNIELTFYGTREQPELYKKGPRKYAPFAIKKPTDG